MSVSYAKNMAVEFADKTTKGIKIDDVLKELQEGKTTIAEVKAMIEGGTLNSVSTPILTSNENEISAQKPVVEVMTGYSANIPSNTGWLIENIYTSACKNGNKLTLVCAAHITKTDASAGVSPGLVYFTIPSSVGDKIYPEDEVFPANEHICAITPHTTFGPNGGKTIYAQIRKTSNTQLAVLLAGQGASFTVNEKNYMRYEITFLLSDNIIN